MRKLFVSVIILILVLSSCNHPGSVEPPLSGVVSPTPAATPTPSPAPTIAPTPSSAQTFIRDSIIEQVLTELTNPDWGQRIVGTDGNIAAGEYLAGLLAHFGYEPYKNDSFF
jgi:hypothetical protein